MALTQKTYTPRAGQITHAWRVMDAQSKPLGRLASEIATYLRGKHLPTFSEHMDVGDHVIVVNASHLKVTGNKLRDKMYYRHSTYPGGLKSVALGDMLAKHPDQVIKHAVKGMLPHNALGRKMLRKLRVYGGPVHPHSAQIIASERAAARAAAAHNQPTSIPEPDEVAVITPLAEPDRDDAAVITPLAEPGPDEVTVITPLAEPERDEIVASTPLVESEPAEVLVETPAVTEVEEHTV